MNTSLINLSDDEITIKFAEAVELAKSGDMQSIATLMADFNALQRPDNDPLKTALLKTSGMLMGGQVEALEAHNDTRKALELTMEWVHDFANIKHTKGELSSTLQAIAWYFTGEQKFDELRKLMNFLTEIKKTELGDFLNNMTSAKLQAMTRALLPVTIADEAAAQLQAKQRKPRAPRKKKTE